MRSGSFEEWEARQAGLGREIEGFVTNVKPKNFAKRFKNMLHKEVTSRDFSKNIGPGGLPYAKPRIVDEKSLAAEGVGVYVVQRQIDEDSTRGEQWEVRCVAVNANGEQFDLTLLPYWISPQKASNNPTQGIAA